MNLIKALENRIRSWLESGSGIPELHPNQRPLPQAQPHDLYRPCIEIEAIEQVFAEFPEFGIQRLVINRNDIVSAAGMNTAIHDALRTWHILAGSDVVLPTFVSPTDRLGDCVPARRVREYLKSWRDHLTKLQAEMRAKYAR